MRIRPPVLAVRLTGWDRLWALSGGLAVPLAAVRGVEVVRRVDADARAGGLRLPGTAVPGVVRAGSYRSPRTGRSLWCAHRAPRVLLVDLTGQRYDHLVLEVADPEGLCRSISRALA